MDNMVPRQNAPAIVLSENAAAGGTASVSRSMFVWIAIAAALAAGLLLAIVWSPALADDAIGENVANTVLLGSAARTAALNSAWFSIAFAIAAGLGTTFTACNCAVFSCIVPLASQREQARLGVGRLLLWMCIGVISVTAVYGIVGAILGSQVPSLSHAVLRIGKGFPVRLLQSTTVFVILGIMLWIWGLVTLRLVNNPLRKVVGERPWMVPLSLGVIVGFFSVGRPFPLFFKLLQYAAGTGNPLLSALLIAIQGLGNIVLMTLLFVVLIYGTQGRFERWMQANPHRARMITAISVIVGGTFLIAYWGIRLPANFGIGWFPHFF